MRLEGRLKRIEQQTGAAGAFRFVIIVPPKLTREEWAEHAREMTERGGFTLNLDAAAVFGSAETGSDGES